MKAFKIIPLLGLLALSACGTPMTFDRHLRQLEGHPVNDADLMLGHHATGQYQDGPATVYVWQDHEAESIFGPAVTGRRGYPIGSPYHGTDALIWSGITLHTCVIRATTLDGIIRDISYEGDPGGCETIYGGRRDALGRDPSP